MGTERETLILLICLIAISSVNGCGQLPQRQARTLNFEVSGFKLPAEMVYSPELNAPSKVPSIATTEQQAVTFVENIIKRSLEDVLYQQGHAAGLSDDVISLILNQLNVAVQYTPLKCDIVFTDLTGAMVVMDMKTNCQIISGTVTKICDKPTMVPMMNPVPAHHMCAAGDLKEISSMYLTISGTITTTNIIMANWSTQMWQSVLNRALRSLTSGSLGSHFFGASVTLK